MFLLFWFINTFAFAVGAEPFQNLGAFASAFIFNLLGVLLLSFVYAAFCLCGVFIVYVVGRNILVASGTGEAVWRNSARLVACSLLIGCLLTAVQLAALPTMDGPLMTPPEGWLTSRLAALACYAVAGGVSVLAVYLAVLVNMRDKPIPASICKACGYEVGALVKCPECGTDRVQSLERGG